MNLSEYGRILWRRGWIVVLLTLLAAGSAFIFSQLQTPVYRSTQKVLVLPSRSDFGLSEANRNLLDSYVVLLTSTYIAQSVIDELQLDMTAGDLLGMVTIQADRQRLTIQIDVDMSDGDMANNVAKAWGQWLVRFRESENQRARREDRIDARLQDEPRYDLLRPRLLVNVGAGVALGVLLGAVVVFVLEYLESNIVRRREDLERAVTLPVLAAIPEDGHRG